MKTTIFFDGGCPLCRREIDHYRRLDAADRCRWVDISLEPEVLAAYGIDYGEAMARLHAVDAQGAVVSGVAAFVATWRELPGYRHLARLLERFALVPLVDRLYTRFAAWRLRRRCREGTSCRAGDGRKLVLPGFGAIRHRDCALRPSMSPGATNRRE